MVAGIGWLSQSFDSVKSFDDELLARLGALDAQGLRRRLRRVDSPQQSLLASEDGRERINFSSNDYLGLANHPALKLAMARAVEEHGVGSGASRLVCGSLKAHHELEEALAAFKQTEAALCFSSGYATALGTIPALVGKSDFVITDKLVHACIIDAVRLSGATLRVFQHNDLEDLERLLRWTQAEREKQGRVSDSSFLGAPTASLGQVLIITESVFSMDGDLAPLRDVVELKDRYGAWLMVDEAHATGLFGERRSGLVEAMAVSDRVEIQMGTLGKALGCSGGYIAGSRALVDWLVNRARSFIFSTAPSPSVAAAAQAAIALLRDEEGEVRRQRVWSRVNRLKETVVGAGWVLPPVQSTILPLIVGAETEAVRWGDGLRDAGFWIPAIRYPTVARGKARLRCTVTADHTPEQIEALGQALASLRSTMPQVPS